MLKNWGSGKKNGFRIKTRVVLQRNSFIFVAAFNGYSFRNVILASGNYCDCE